MTFPKAASLALVLGLLVTCALFAELRSFERHKAENDFQRRAKVRVAAVREGMRSAIDSLQTTNRLFATIGSVSSNQFEHFTQPLLQRYPYIQAFSFHRIITAAERPQYEAEMRRNHPGYEITEMVEGKLFPAKQRDTYRVVHYVVPTNGNETVLGFDAGSYGSQTDAMLRAVDTGLPTSTGMLKLISSPDLLRGFIVLMPVYRPGAPVDDVESRRRAVIGDTAVIFRAGSLVDRILTSSGLLKNPGFDIRLYAGQSNQDADLVFHSGETLSSLKSGSGLLQWVLYDQADPVSETFEVAGKTWLMVIAAPPVWFTANNTGSAIILIAGVLFSLLAAAYLHSVVVRSVRNLHLVGQRTAELKQSNDLRIEDSAARERTEQALRLRERAIDASANAIIILNATPPDYLIEYVNPAFERITGYSLNEVVGQCFRFLQSDDYDQPSIDEIRASLREKREGHVTLRNQRKDGSSFWNDIYIAPVSDRSGDVSHFVVTQYDITSTKRYEAELEFQANRDVLTGLANRNLLRDRLRQAVAYAERYGHPVWVVFIDLDRFKFVNDTLGHRAGDLLLNKVAERLLGAVRLTDTVARLGGDEFAILLVERTDERLTVASVQRIMDALSAPLTVDGHEFFVTCSTGVATYPTDGHDADVLIKNAEIAMYRAKELGRNNFQFYTAAMNAEALERLRIEGNLRNAIEREEFVLHYQPQVDLHTGRIIGMEALIRWHHPELGMVPPARFIGLAEETGLIVPIGMWVTRTACKQNKAWQDAGFGELRIAVNLSARQFYQQDLVQSIADILKESGLAPQYLEFELTEGLVMTDVEKAIGILRDMNALGVQISIDDFGTGYSSLAYLKRFPIDILKIDQSFVRDITLDADDAAIVVSIISLAHNLRLQVIAEGVETQEQLTYLSRHGCDQIQGYFFSRPVPAELFAELLEQGKCLPGELRTVPEPERFSGTY